MLVVADSSPLIALVEIGHIDVLATLFREVIIPPAVERELTDTRRAPRVREYFASRPSWLSLRQPVKVQHIDLLHRGEEEALALAIELRADLLLVDERRAYREAVALHVNAIGTVRVLERAAEEGLLELDEAFAALKRSSFWVSQDLLDERLRAHRANKGG